MSHYRRDYAIDPTAKGGDSRRLFLLLGIPRSAAISTAKGVSLCLHPIQA
jgi:hypothetical protein